MVRRGFVQSGGAWITKAEHDLNRQRADTELAMRRAAQQEAARRVREERLAALAEISLIRESARSSAPAYPVAPYVVLPSYWLPPILLPPVPREPDPQEPPPHRPPRRHEPEPARHHRGGIRIPGSLIPFDGVR
jgi:hypothetical protein